MLGDRARAQVRGFVAVDVGPACSFDSLGDIKADDVDGRAVLGADGGNGCGLDFGGGDVVGDERGPDSLGLVLGRGGKCDQGLIDKRGSYGVATGDFGFASASAGVDDFEFCFIGPEAGLGWVGLEVFPGAGAGGVEEVEVHFWVLDAALLRIAVWPQLRSPPQN